MYKNKILIKTRTCNLFYMFVGVVYGKVARFYILIIKYRHNVTGVGAVPGALSDAPFYEGHHGWPVDPSDCIDSRMYRIEFEDTFLLRYTCSAVFRT